MSGCTITISDEEKREFENKPFLLISSAPWFVECPPAIDEDAELILNENKEDGGKTIFLSHFDGMKKYKDSPKKKYLVNLFGEVYWSLENLRENLRNGGLEKTAAAIEMLPVNETKFGIITYPRKGGVKGHFGYYKTIES